MITDIDAFVAAGLYDPDAPGAADRLSLLEHLAGLGFGVEEMAVAAREGRLSLLSVERLLAERMHGLTRDEVAARTGLSTELIGRAQRAMGLPLLDAPVYDERSTAAFGAAAAFFGTDQALQFSRVVGSSIARIIDGALSLFTNEMVAESASELEVSTRGEGATDMLLSLPETIAQLFPAYVADAIRRLRLVAEPSTEGVRVAVGFVDLVESTRLVQELSGAELARAVGEFETAAYDLALSHDARIVKFIGDEAMFVASDPHASVAIGVGLCEVVAAHPILDAARGAVGLGAALSQGGDFYGPMVNQVSRLTGRAAPGQLLVTPPLVAAMNGEGSAYRFEPAGSHRLRGFNEPLEVYAVTRR